MDKPNDHELLEWAAKAAGVNLAGGVDEHGAYEENWNPLTDDGDALRLAVKLDLLSSDAFWRERSIQCAMDAMNGGRQDPYAATRRAIVRAAAEIGKAMK